MWFGTVSPAPLNLMSVAGTQECEASFVKIPSNLVGSLFQCIGAINPGQVNSIANVMFVQKVVGVVDA